MTISVPVRGADGFDRWLSQNAETLLNDLHDRWMSQRPEDDP